MKKTFSQMILGLYCAAVLAGGSNCIGSRDVSCSLLGGILQHISYFRDFVIQSCKISAVDKDLLFG